jgi:F420-dependent oxidoreductase-like protein
VAVFRRGMHFGSYSFADDPAAVWRRLVEALRAAEQCGFDFISVPDHLAQNRIGGGPLAPMFEAYTLLGSLAMVTERVRLAALVSPITFRPPAVLAKAVCTLDVASGGRAVLGVGAGWDQSEHEAYGIPFPSVRERMDRLDETLSVCRAMFSERQSSFSGRHYSITDAPSSPLPQSGHLPILVGGGGERRTLRLAAQHADVCNVSGDAETVRHKLEVLEQHCAAVGRDPKELTKTVFTVARDPDEAAAGLSALPEVGVDGAVVLGSADPAVIERWGDILKRTFPDDR